MGQKLTDDWVGQLVLASTTTITMALTYLGLPVRITVGGQQYQQTAAITMNLATTGVNALDSGALVLNTLYYIYAIVSGGALALVASTNAPTTGPTGYTSWKEIGRFRTFLGSASIAAISNRLIGAGVAPGMTPWASFTPNFSLTTNATTIGRRKIDGGNLKGEITTTFAGANTQAVGVNLVLPDGFSYDSSILPLNTTRNFGYGNLRDSSGLSFYSLRIITTNATTLRLIFDSTGGLNSGIIANVMDTSANLPIPIASGDEITFNFDIPIAEYVGLYD